MGVSILGMLATLRDESSVVPWMVSPGLLNAGVFICQKYICIHSTNISNIYYVPSIIVQLLVLQGRKSSIKVIELLITDGRRAKEESDFRLPREHTHRGMIALGDPFSIIRTAWAQKLGSHRANRKVLANLDFFHCTLVLVLLLTIRVTLKKSFASLCLACFICKMKSL